MYLCASQGHKQVLACRRLSEACRIDYHLPWYYFPSLKKDPSTIAAVEACWCSAPHTLQNDVRGQHAKTNTRYAASEEVERTDTDSVRTAIRRCQHELSVDLSLIHI